MKCDKIFPDLNKPTSEEVMKSAEYVDQIMDLVKLSKYTVFINFI